jgi:hypothetical protein
MARLRLALKALHELGPRQLGLYALYQLGLQSGYFRWKTEDRGRKTVRSGPRSWAPRHLLDLPDPNEISALIGPNGLTQLTAEADEIVTGQVRLFGAQPVPLILTPPIELSHWTDHKSAHIRVDQRPIDIKFIWEPARFGWALTLGRTYHLTSDERYPEAFWQYFEVFQAANPVNMGPNWASAQEVALRLISFAFAAQFFANSPHSSAIRNSQLATAIVEHALRIPPTLFYARAQNNNHLLSEAAGLITAALALPDHPQAPKWHHLGWKWFQRGLETQIAVDGTYMQQSVNYHRLILQLGLWVFGMMGPESGDMDGKLEAGRVKLAKATEWLLGLVDAETGRVPNLGPNDGAYIFPLTILPFHDYRPVLQAASQVFLGKDAFELGEWDEIGMWLATGDRGRKTGKVFESDNSVLSYALQPCTSNPQLSSLHSTHSWAYLRAAQFHDRPGHADQLHLDLWWRGFNVAQDAGTYLYNADPPWNNALTHTAVHNTVMIDNRPQMTPAGKFLYLDRAQAEIIAHEWAEDDSWQQISAQHDGYQKIDIIHQRTVTAFKSDNWRIADRIFTSDLATRQSHSARLHWLLPDWEWRVTNDDLGIGNLELGILSPHGWVDLQIQVDNLKSKLFNIQLVRAGETIHGFGKISSTWGWVSPTYGEKIPALSFSVSVKEKLPIKFISTWRFPGE